MSENDTFKTIESPPRPVIFKEKKSKFYAYTFDIKEEATAKHHIEHLKRKHPTAKHCCYAYQIGTSSKIKKTFDDGEPHNSAGGSIYSQIKSFEVTNVLVVIIRYFGGIKLGIGGLASAYKMAARMTLSEATIITKTINKEYLLSFKYKELHKVMKIIKEHQLTITQKELELDCNIIIGVRANEAESVCDVFKSMYGVVITKL